MIFGYNGRDGVITDANGLLYMRARYYSPELRRFINADIVPGEISNAITLNRYAYANGNPVSNIDPFGLLSIWAKIAIGAAAILVGAAVAAATAVTGGAAAAFVGATIAGVKSAAVSGLVAAGTSAAITATKSVISGDDIKTVVKKTAEATVEGFADGFMLSGVTTGVSRSLGYVTSKTGIFNRTVKFGKNNFMFGKSELTIWKHGRNFRIDTNATKGLHYHLRTAKVGIGIHRYKYIPEIIGIVAGVGNAVPKITRSK